MYIPTGNTSLQLGSPAPTQVVRLQASSYPNAGVSVPESPVSTRRFNAYKENRDNLNTHSMLNASSASIKLGQASPLQADIDKIVRQAVAEAVRSDKQLQQVPFPPSTPSSAQLAPSDLKQLQEAFVREREERKQLKALLKAEKKQSEALIAQLKQSEQESNDARKFDREVKNLRKENEILQSEISQLRQEKILSDQLDEEHSAKMRIYTQELMATSTKYQDDLKTLLAKNEKIMKELEVVKAKSKELERQNTHLQSVQESLDQKLARKETEISDLKRQVKNPPAPPAPPKKQPAEEISTKIRELESVIKFQKDSIAELENRLARQQAIGVTTQVVPQSPKDDAFGILRSSKNLPSPNQRRVSQLTSRGPALESFAPVALGSDVADWLEPLAIAEHVLAAGATSA